LHLRNWKLSVCRKAVMTGFSVITLSTFAPSARASLVFNGSFESTTNGPGQMGYNTDATGWTNESDGVGDDGYNFIFASGTADSTGSNGIYGNLQLWGPNNGSANGLPASSPDGGNFVAADGAFEIGAIEQTISGLVAGDVYTVGFWWAGAQQSGFTGPNTEQWQVSFGSEQLSTPVYSNPSEGFSGWMYQTFNFTADNTSDVLSFLAVGTPNGEPPFSLLDGVSVQAAPEPGTLLLMLGGLGLVGLGVVRSKRRSKV
jgi:hypothetical protein